MSHFFDSSAIIEMINNPNIELASKDKSIITNALHIGEVYYYFLKEHNKTTADFWMRELEFELIEPELAISLEAAQFKFEHRNIHFSYIDCIGYISALKNKLIFLTKDKDFSGFENVEFVKDV